MSFSQSRLWFLNELETGSPVYNRPVVLRLAGILRYDILELALNEIVRRHEVFRTSFPAVEGRHVQVVAQELHLPLRLFDLNHLMPEERSARERETILGEARRSFDLANGPLIRVLLIRSGCKDHILLTTVHHSVFDGWSSQIFLRELSVLYDAFASGASSPLPALPLQYADFAVWQRGRMEHPEMAEQLSYWRERLDGISVLDLSNGRRTSSRQTMPGGRRPFRIPKPLSDAVRELARQERVTLFSMLLAAFKLLLHRYSGQDDMSIGCPVAGRRRTEVESLIGCFVNTLVLRTDLSGNPSFRELLKRVQETTLGALSNQDIPFEKIVEELQPARSLTRSPFFQVFFQLRNYPRNQRLCGELTISEEKSIDLEHAGLDLTLELSEDAQGLAGSFIYKFDVFDAHAIAHIAEQYIELLKQIVASPDRPIGEYSLLTRSSQSILSDPNLRIGEPPYKPVLESFRSWAALAPERMAIRHNDREWSYRELEAQVDRLARGLLTAGVNRGEPVGIFGPRSYGTTTAMLAVLAAGGVMLPLAIDLPEERRRTMLSDAGVRLLITVGARDPGTSVQQRPDGVRILHVDADTAELRKDARIDSDSDETLDLPRVRPDDPAYIFYTSGTSGLPKGVLGVHKGVSHFLEWQRKTFAVDPLDRCAHLTALSFDVVLRDVFLPLTSGAALCIPPEDQEPGDVLAWLASEKATILHTVPSVARSWLSHDTSAATIPSLRLTFFAGEPLTDVLVSEWRGRLAGEIVNLYGPSESTMVKCFHRVPENVPKGIQPVGRPLPHAQALVLSPGNRLCGVNEPGEVCIRTPFATRGYINRPDENRRCFIVNPFRDDALDMFYRTGDLGYIGADGLLVLNGRLDHQVKIRGVRIEPDEITAVLERHEGVASAYVVGRTDGAGNAMLAAYVAARYQGLTAATLQSYLARHLPAAMIPAAIAVLDALPLTPNGKLDRSRLPDPVPADAVPPYTAPRTPDEALIAQIWSDVLNRDAIGIDDDIFDLGGHSLLILGIASRMRDQLGFDVTLQQFFETPTVRQLTRAITAFRM